MKLAESLVLRADIQKRVEQLRVRLTRSAVVQEGNQPPEDPAALLAELNELLTQLVALIERINRTNLRTSLPDGTTLTAGLAQRDVLALRMNILTTVADTASSLTSRYSRTEILQVATVNVRALRRELDDLARQRRELDTAIQATNWATDLLE